MKSNHLTVCEKEIHVYDGLVNFSFREHAYSIVRNSLFRIGNEDGDAIETADHKYLCSYYNQHDLDSIGLMQAIEGTEAQKHLIGKTLDRIHVNLSTPMDTNWAHDHRGHTVLLYYVNKHWKHEWAGETMFFNDDMTEVEYASKYTPGRIVIFDGEIPHSVRPQAASAPMYRFTLSLFFKHEVKNASIS